MPGVIYLLLCAAFGWIVMEEFYPHTEIKNKGAENRFWVVMPASFGVGILLITWAVYGTAWFFYAALGSEKPLMWGNWIVLGLSLIHIYYWREIHQKAGYVEISTPIMLSRHLWETSGHWDHYKENMYTTVIDETEFAIKPMNCPGGILVYKSEPRSYRDLPLRMGELGLVHRHEKDVYKRQGMARMVRGQILTIKQNEYVLAAKISGAKAGRIIRKHILPNCILSLIHI